jgi:hypothetical protein
MDKQRIESTVSEIFEENLAELKKGKTVEMNFYLFFADGYWKFPETNLPKEGLFAMVNIVVNALKPEAYCLVSDTNARDPKTYEIMYEQLFACVVEPAGVKMSIAKPYDRLPNGKIKTRPQESMDNVSMGGRVTEMYDPAPAIFPDERTKSLFIEMHKSMVAKDKVAYRDITKAADEKPESDAKVQSRHVADDGLGR